MKLQSVFVLMVSTHVNHVLHKKKSFTQQVLQICEICKYFLHMTKPYDITVLVFYSDEAFLEKKRREISLTFY